MRREEVVYKIQFMRSEGVNIGEYGYTLILPNVTTVPATGNYWCKINVINDMEVTALVGAGGTGTHSTQTYKFGSTLNGHFTSITCSNTLTTGFMQGVLGRPTP